MRPCGARVWQQPVLGCAGAMLCAHSPGPPVSTAAGAPCGGPPSGPIVVSVGLEAPFERGGRNQGDLLQVAPGQRKHARVGPRPSFARCGSIATRSVQDEPFTLAIYLATCGGPEAQAKAQPHA